MLLINVVKSKCIFKAEYVIAKNLAGTMWWSLDHDDPAALCGQGRFPLINTGLIVFILIK